MEEVDTNQYFKFLCLGGGNEVGRSCHILEYMGKVVMLDAGVHPSNLGLNSLPFYDEYDLSKVDVLLISHFHLDHAASLPYVMRHTNFNGRVFMTHPTKAIYKWLLSDFVKVTSIGDEASHLYSDEDLTDSFDRIETVDYHSTVELDGIKFTAYHAGHVLGAAMFFVEIGSLKILFTGDYSREIDRHLNAAEVPPQRPDILICESTFGTATHEPRLAKEARLTALVHKTVTNGGRVLLPVFALGRAQELLLVLEEYWENTPELELINVYYASSLAKKCMSVYRTYVNMMNESIRMRFRSENLNPFKFKHIRSVKNLDRSEDLLPCVMVASPGMLQNGVSRELLERWCPETKNALVITGYCVEGTMAKQILTEPLEIASVANPDQMIPRRMSVDEISFAAHVDYEQNSKFIELVDPKSIILVHGESNPMGRLKSALLSKYSKLKNTSSEVKVYTPKNGEELMIQCEGVKIAKAVGQIAELNRHPGELISGLLVSKNFDLNLLKVDDLREFSSLTTTVVTERQSIKITSGRELIRWHLSQMFGYVEIVHENEDEFELKIMNDVIVSIEDDICTIQWTSGLVNDTIADSVIATLISVDSSPASVKLTSKPGHSHSHEKPKADIKEELVEAHSSSDIKVRIHRIISLLKAQFGESFAAGEKGGTVSIGPTDAKIDFVTLSVDCKSNVLRTRIEQIINRGTDLTAPLARAR